MIELLHDIHGTNKIKRYKSTRNNYLPIEGFDQPCVRGNLHLLESEGEAGAKKSMNTP